MTDRKWGGRVAQRARAYVAAMLPLQCSKCGGEVTPDMAWDLDHVPPRATLTWEEQCDPTTWRAAHRRCNRSRGAALGNAMRGRRAQPPVKKAVEKGGTLFRGKQDTPPPQLPNTPLGMPKSSKVAPVTLLSSARHPKWFPESLRTIPGNATLPRLETPHHSRAVGTYGPRVVAHAAGYGIEMRWWQQYVMARLLEHDAEGRLLWAEAAISVARQVGKGFGGIRPLAQWRMTSGPLFGEPQTVLHLGHQVNVVMEIATPAIALAREAGARVRLTNGEQSIQISDGSRWLMRSTSGAYGFSVNMAVVDEVWAVQPRVIDSMVMPTMTERSNPQLVLWSTANASPTSTYSRFRHAAGEAEDRLLLEWSPPEEARDDPYNRRFWQMGAPYWSEQRQRMMERQVEKASRADFMANWLNLWPLDVISGADRAMPGWESLPMAGAMPPRGGIVAIDESRVGDRFARVVLQGGQVWYDEALQLQDLVGRASVADTAIIGMTLTEAAAKAGLRGMPRRFGMKETRFATPLLTQTVKSGTLRHNHDAEMGVQAMGAVVTETESGRSLSARRSESEILGPKLLAWALYAERTTHAVRPAIW